MVGGRRASPSRLGRRRRSMSATSSSILLEVSRMQPHSAHTSHHALLSSHDRLLRLLSLRAHSDRRSGDPLRRIRLRDLTLLCGGRGDTGARAQGPIAADTRPRACESTAGSGINRFRRRRWRVELLEQLCAVWRHARAEGQLLEPLGCGGAGGGGGQARRRAQPWPGSA